MLMCAGSQAALVVNNGNFETGASDNATDINGWFDYDAGNFWEQAWLESGDTPDDYGAALALAGGGFLGNAWAYQGIGTADGATSLQVTFDYGSFQDAGNNRDLGVYWEVYAVTGSFTPGQNSDIAASGEATLLDTQFASSLQVAPGAKAGITTVTLDLSTAGASQLYLRVANYSPTNNTGDNGYLWVDNVSIAAVPEPGTVAMLIAGACTLAFFRRRKA
jgi:hypothetical protein